MDCNNKSKNNKDPSQQNYEERTEIPSILTSITTTFQSTDVS